MSATDRIPTAADYAVDADMADLDRVYQYMEDGQARPSFWGEPISIYTRKQAIEDGVLVDVSETAREAGWKYPVAITASVHALINAIPKSQRHQSYTGRLWDVLWMGRLAAKRGGTEIRYQLIMHHGRQVYATLKAICGPGDTVDPVITIMLPDED